jgi:hypothetical protein
VKNIWHGWRALFLLSSAGMSLFYWNAPVLLPFKLLAVMGHETGHALAALAVGGAIEGVSLSSNEAGQCVSRIPEGFFARAVVSSSGYVGASLISLILLVLTFRFEIKRPLLWSAALWLGAMGIFAGKDLFTLVFCVAMALILAACARWLPLELISGLNLFLASFTALYALVDLKDDLWNSAVRAQSDAQILADATRVPAVVWAFVWTAASLFALGAGTWFALRGPASAGRKEKSA